MSTKVHYRPWVGKNYENGKLYGKRIMILGESHYGKELGEVNDTTSQVIDEAEFQHLYTTRFLRMIPPAVMGYSSSDSLTYEQRKEFWDSVLFYNYIQESVNGGPRGSRTKKQWSDAAEPFLEVINQYKPEIILVFGVGIGNNLTRKNAVNKDIKGLKVVEYTLNEGFKSIAAAVRHPAGGMSYEEVHNVVDKILK